MPDPFMPDVEVHIAFGASYTTVDLSRVWTDVSAYVDLEDQLQISLGRQDERSNADANQLTLTLDNSDGRFTAGRAASPYYPNVKIGRPIRVLATSPDAPNLITNPGAEVNATGWSGFGGASVSRSTTRAHAGPASFLCTWPTAAAEASTVFTTVSGLTVGKLYRYEAYVYVPTSQPRMRLKASVALSPPSTLTNQWERLSVTFRAAATTQDIEVKHADASTAGQTGYFDSTRAQLTSFRFTGFVDEWPVEWDGSDAYAKAKIKGSSRLARLGLSAKLKSMAEMEILTASPIAYYTLGEPSGALQASDSSAFASPPLVGYNPTGLLSAPVFGEATGPGADDLTALLYPAGGGSNRWPLRAETSGSTVASCRIAVTLPAAGSDTIQIMEVGGEAGKALDVYASSTNVVTAQVIQAGSIIATASSAALAAGSYDIAVNCTAAGGLALYVDGALVGSDSATDLGEVSYIQVGGNSTREVVLSHAAVFPAELTLTQIGNHAQALVSGFAGERTDQRAVRLLGWAGVGAPEVFAETGAETMTYQKTAGQSVVDALREVESTEGGVLYDGQDGRVTLRNRSHRYLEAPAVTLDMAAQHVGADYSPKLDRSALLNDVEVSNPVTAESARAVDQASVDDYGAASGSAKSLAEDYEPLQQKAAWLVGSYSQPRARVPSLTVDVVAHKGLTPTIQDLLDLTVGDLIAVVNAPAQAESSTPSYFAEGYTETIGPESYLITFNLSPSYPTLSTFVLGDATRGKLDDAYVLAL